MCVRVLVWWIWIRATRGIGRVWVRRIGVRIWAIRCICVGIVRRVRIGVVWRIGIVWWVRIGAIWGIGIGVQRNGGWICGVRAMRSIHIGAKRRI